MRTITLLFALVGGFSIHALAQDSQPQVLTRIAMLAGDFTEIGPVRELSDGRILVADVRDHALRVVSASGGTRAPIGRQGSGPGEYRSPSRLFAFGHDSTLLVDGTTRRWQMLDRTAFVELPPSLNANLLSVGAELTGMDKAGNLLLLHGFGPGKPGQGKYDATNPATADSIVVVRISRAGAHDSVARIEGGWLGRRRHMLIVNGMRDFWELGNPLATRDQAAIFADGTIALASAAPYRVDWLKTEGARVIGREIVEMPVPVTASIRDVMAREALHPDAPKFKPGDFPPWPAFVPPFTGGALHAGADGRLYVARTVLSKRGVRVYDVFDQAGHRTTFRLPAGSRLVGSGTRGLYVAVTDQDDVESLALFRFPP